VKLNEVPRKCVHLTVDHQFLELCGSNALLYFARLRTF